MAGSNYHHRLTYTAHAATVLIDRKLERAWVEQTISEPAWTEPDPRDPAITRAFANIVEAGGRVLRVVYTHDEGGIRVVTAFFDRDARNPERSG